ncbi:vWA domain-containing protein [Luteolibacter luteus]|uniref:VWA domain-containing protein n=1 Tax=Luteolibacter luteus TaxID=2728835 RepID=A0A858RHG6_9BACT|nr:vWA domain-containing protein [Luteolibacter luteus]QJE96262.1 VWA domain-containing protein [Luteolibacter luteus]
MSAEDDEIVEEGVVDAVQPAVFAGPAYRQEGSLHRFWRKLGGGSLMTATLLHIGLLLIATTIVLRTIQEPEKKVEFLSGPAGGGGGGGEMQKKAERQAKSLSVSSAKRVFAEGVATSMTLPDPGDSFGQLSSLGSLSGGGGVGGGEGFGRGGGKGSGIGPGSGPGAGIGGMGQGIVFFEQEIHAGRVAYVIDYSGSMRGKREKLMRAELSKSVQNLASTMQYQLIFFCGPVWIAGDQFKTEENGDVLITHGKDKYRWKRGAAPGSWEPKGRTPKAEWLTADSATVEQSVKFIKETELQSGTHWVAPLEMALAMKPAPQVIFFMTDGASPGTTEEDIRRLGKRAKSLKVTINTMAMMEPKAEEGMKELARLSGGSFTIIDADGSVRDVPVE